jgi:hypothetical protein
MNEQNVDIRSETRALKRSVAAALARQKRRYNGTEASALLLLEPNFAQIPSALIEDTDLAPVDKVIWLVLMVRACNGDGVTVVPTHWELARSANVAARQTVSRALSILRCRRWLTVCQTSWRKGGRQKSSAYALHTTPLPIADAIYLDPHYPAFVEELTGQHRGRVQKVACDVRAQLSH